MSQVRMNSPRLKQPCSVISQFVYEYILFVSITSGTGVKQTNDLFLFLLLAAVSCLSCLFERQLSLWSDVPIDDRCRQTEYKAN